MNPWVAYSWLKQIPNMGSNQICRDREWKSFRFLPGNEQTLSFYGKISKIPLVFSQNCLCWSVIFSFCQTFCLSFGLSVFLSVCLIVCLSSIFNFVCLSFRTSAFLSFLFSVCFLSQKDSWLIFVFKYTLCTPHSRKKGEMDTKLLIWEYLNLKLNTWLLPLSCFFS